MEPTVTSPGQGQGLRPAVHLAAAVLLGQASVTGPSDAFNPVAVALAGGGVALMVVALVLPWESNPRVAAWATRAVLVIGVALSLARLPLIDLYVRFPAGRPRLQPFVLLAILAVAASAVVMAERPRAILPACGPLLLTTFGLMAAFYLQISPEPKGDVFLVNRLGCEALAAGRDPYRMTFPNPYAPYTGYYPSGTVVNGTVQCGYPYPPLPLVAGLPGHLLAGDVRWSELAAYGLTAALLAYAIPRRGQPRSVAEAATRWRRMGPVILILFAPGVFHLLENGSTEPVLILLLVTTVTLASRGHARSAVFLGGMLLTAKQYVPPAAPALLLLVPRPWRVPRLARWACLAALGAAIVPLPFLLWDGRAFIRDQYVLNTGLLRVDSIGLLPVLSKYVHWRATLLPALIGSVTAAGLVLWKAPRTPAGFSAGVALICTCVFYFGNQAHANNYAFSIGSLCAAAAFDGIGQDPRALPG